tara:strand:+ start:1353 stop:1673 length:321 start_codon:yes stop_codon:yes gene_type:complete
MILRSCIIKENAMEYSKNNGLLLKFLIDNKRYWSFEDFKEAFGSSAIKSNTRTLNTLKYKIVSGGVSNGQITKYKESIIDLCKIVKKKLDDEKEILESIKLYQTVN